MRDALDSADIDGWKIYTSRQRSFNLYTTKDFEIQDYLEGDRDEAFVTIYKRFGDELGECTFSAYEDFEDKLDESILIASNSTKRPYSIPKKRQRAEVDLLDKDLCDAADKGEAHKIAYDIRRRAKEEFDNNEGVILNEMEVLLNIKEIGVENSLGLKDSFFKTKLFVHMMITAKDDEKEMEFFSSRAVGRVSDLDVKKFVKDNVQTARDAMAAQKTESFEGKVLLSGKAVEDFFYPHLGTNPLVVHASGRLSHMGLSTYKEGEPIIKDVKGDKLTIFSNPLLDFNTASSPFDEDGVAGKRVCLIEEGIFRRRFSSQRYADYLGIEPTGGLGAVEILPGSATDIALEGVVEIVSFASFVPNFISGDFSAEIRMAYRHEDGKKIPLRGGMFTGNVFHLFKDALLSKKMIKGEGYHGPDKVLFRDGVISGI